MFISFATHGRDDKRTLLTVSHHIGLTLPRVVSAKFSDSLDRVIVTFDNVVKPVAENTTLAELFPLNHTAFGEKAYVEFSSRRLVVFLLGGPTVGIGRLLLDTDKIRSRAARTIYQPGDVDTFDLGKPDKVRMPNVQVMGPSSVGMYLLGRYIFL